MATKFSTYVSSLTIRLGPIVTQGKLISVQKPKSKQSKPQFHYITPEGSRVNRTFVDPETGTLYTEDELLKEETLSHAEIETGVEAAVVTQDQIDAQKGSVLPKNVVNLTVHDSEDVDESLFPGQTNAYVFIPDSQDPANEQWYAMLLSLVQDTDKAFVAVANIKNFEGIYRLGFWRGNLIIQKQVFPEDINPHEPAAVKFPVDDKALNKGRVIVAKMTKPFDFETYRNTEGEALRNLVEGVKVGEVETGQVVKAATASELDLDSILDAFGDFDE